MEEGGEGELPERAETRHRRARQHVQLPRRYVDLDPTYKDRFGRPLARITRELHDNETSRNKFLTDKFAEIFQAMGAKQVHKEYRKGPYDITKYQTTHLCGGANTGTDPSTSAINRVCKAWMC